MPARSPCPAMLYLWPENKDGEAFLHLLSPGRHARLPVPDVPQAQQALPDAFLTAVDDALNSAGSEQVQALLLLDAALPAAWQHAPWERCLVRGHPLSRHFLVVRHARPVFDCQPADTAGAHPAPYATALLNLFPAAEFTFDFGQTVARPNLISPRWMAR